MPQVGLGISVRHTAEPSPLTVSSSQHRPTGVATSTAIRDAAPTPLADRGKRRCSNPGDRPNAPSVPREWRRSAFTILLPRGSRLRWRVAIPSDRGRGPPHPPGSANRQDGAQLVLLASSREGRQDDGPDDCTTDAVGRIASQSISHPRIIAAHRPSLLIRASAAPATALATTRDALASKCMMLGC